MSSPCCVQSALVQSEGRVREKKAEKLNDGARVERSGCGEKGEEYYSIWFTISQRQISLLISSTSLF